MTREEIQKRVRGLYGLADAEASGGDPERLAAQMLEGGCRLLQLRCKDWPADEVLRVARALVPRCRALGATFLVNDLCEVAAAADAHGVHLGQLDLPTAEARRLLGPGRMLGRSTNDPAQVAKVDADYLAFGPVFETAHISRPKQVQGLQRLAAVRRAVPELPLVAIGGIDAGRLPEVRTAGADAWAVIGAIAGAADPVAAVRGLVG